VHLEDAVAVGRGDLRVVDPLRQPDGPAVRAEPPLEAVVAVGRPLDRLLALGGDGERVVLNLDRDLLLGDAGEVERVDELVPVSQTSSAGTQLCPVRAGVSKTPLSSLLTSLWNEASSRNGSQRTSVAMVLPPESSY
jgi:hypothetical protein